MPWDWVTFPEFLDSVDRTPKGVNVMSLVPLAPLYGYVVGVDKAKEQRATDEELEKMCQLIVEAMEAGGCGWSSQILGDVGNVQRDYDGTPMVTDQMTEREVVAFSRALRNIGRGTTQITGTAGDRGDHRPRERPADHLERARRRAAAVNQHGEMEYPHRRRSRVSRELNEEEGVRVFAQAQHRPVPLGDHPRGIQPHGHLPGVAGSVPRHGRGEDRQVRRPRAAGGPEGRDQSRRGGGFGVARYPLDEIKVNWISSDAPNAQELKERYEGWTIGEIAAREDKDLIDAMLDVAVLADLKVGLRHDDGRDGPGGR